METIINNEDSFKPMLKFLRKHFEKVRVIKNKYSHLAADSQNCFITVLFENRGAIFSIKWNYYYSTLFFGDITKNKKTSLQYTFTKIKIDDCYPIEIGNNLNVVFWEYEIANSHDDISMAISPLRFPITKH